MKILIATNNLSKSDLIVPLLKSAGLQQYDFVRPVDLNVAIDVNETGSLQHRARQKALAAYAALRSTLWAKEIFLYVGSDDGIRIERDKKTHAASKEATDRILHGEGVENGDSITIVRAFAFVDVRGEVISFVTRVPMTYLGNPQGIERQEGMYPLEYVLTYKGSATPISEMDQETKDRLNQKRMLPTVSKALCQLGALR